MAVGCRRSLACDPGPVQARIIQGGMGVAVSSWRLARAVASLGQLGVVSGTALDTVLARRLQLGDPDGALRAALARFPYPDVTQRALARHFIASGKAADAPFRPVPMPTLDPGREQVELTVLGAFVEVWLAKSGHDGRIGINLLEKIQLQTLPTLYGALLAGVDCVLMGAGIPRHIPQALAALAAGARAEIPVDVEDAPAGARYVARWDPAQLACGPPPTLRRPEFLAIVSSASLAAALERRTGGAVDGFVLEQPSAGGHNAPPRGALRLSPQGEPLYGPRDEPDLAALRAVGRPFWLAGSYGTPRGLAYALAQGAAGVQVGTAFAWCEESGLTPAIRRAGIAASRAGRTRVFTDPDASPTGFPFKVLALEGSLSDPALAAERERVCDLGLLRRPFRRPDDTIGYRCPAEPIADYVRKGGSVEDALRRKCICNALSADVGLEQVRRGGGHELPLVTAGLDAARVADFCLPGRDTYSAADVVARILAGVPPPP